MGLMTGLLSSMASFYTGKEFPYRGDVLITANRHFQCDEITD